MRVIAGSARRLQLKTIDGLATRPTTDRIKETLFNMLQNDISGAVMIDLFAGSGAIGIEALSRGASKVYFADNNRQCIECIKSNLTFTKLLDKAQILETDAVTAVNRINVTTPVDIIFMDPPYNNLLEKQVLDVLKNSDIIDKYTTIIVEADLNTSFDYVDELGYSIEKEKIYKTNKHVFLKRV